MVDEDDIDEEDLEAEAEGLSDDVALAPNEAADPQSIVDLKVPQDIRDKYEIISYRNAAVILAETRQAQYAEVLEALTVMSGRLQLNRPGFFGGSNS